MFNSLFKLAANTIKIADAVVTVPLEIVGAVVKPIADAAETIKDDVTDAMR